MQAEEASDEGIAEEYCTWKANSPFLYDTVITHMLNWPSLTVEWLPLKELPENSDYSIQRLVLGTHTNREEDDQLIIASVKLPLEGGDVAGATVAAGKSAGTAFLSKTPIKIEPVSVLSHQGEVNKARHMPQQPNIIATRPPSGDIFVFDLAAYAETRSEPIKLIGHKQEGFGLDWSPVTLGRLASGGIDKVVCLWDVGSASTQSPVRQLGRHTEVISEVAWSGHQADLLASVGDDRKLILWDCRQNEPAHCLDAHEAEINAVDFNKKDPNLLATGSTDKTVAIWDQRKLTVKMAELEYHNNSVFNVRWAPYSSTLLASGSSDRRVCIWDLARLGEEQGTEDNDDAPPEMLFVHGGHCAPISDLSWNPNDQLVLASVAEDNLLHVWQMAKSLLTTEFEVPEDIAVEA